MEIIGYTHSDGYALCTDCEDGTTEDQGNETGFVYPIFAGDEWDSYPTCDNCGCEIETSLTSDGMKWLEERNEEE